MLGAGRVINRSCWMYAVVRFTISVAQHIIIKFLPCGGVTHSLKIYRLMQQVGNQILLKPPVFAWHKKFWGGLEGVENESPWSSSTDEQYRIEHSCLREGDRHLTVSEISSEIRISYETTQAIIAKDLGFRKVGFLVCWLQNRSWHVCKSVSASRHGLEKKGKHFWIAS